METKKTEKEGSDIHYLRAELVESKRIDGKPRQKTVKYKEDIDMKHLSLNLEDGMHKKLKIISVVSGKTITIAPRI